MRSFRSYLLFILVLYLSLVLLFHVQIHFYHSLTAPYSTPSTPLSSTLTVNSLATNRRSDINSDDDDDVDIPDTKSIEDVENAYRLDYIPGDSGLRGQSNLGISRLGSASKHGGTLRLRSGEEGHRLKDDERDQDDSATDRDRKATNRASTAKRRRRVKHDDIKKDDNVHERCQSEPDEISEPSLFEFKALGAHFLYSAYYDDRLLTPASRKREEFQHGGQTPVETVTGSEGRTSNVVGVPGKTYVRVIALLRQNEKPELFCHFPMRSQTNSRQRLGSREWIQKSWNSQILKNTTTKSNNDTRTNRVKYHEIIRRNLFTTVRATLYEMCENHNMDYGGWIVSCELRLFLPLPSRLRRRDYRRRRRRLKRLNCIETGPPTFVIISLNSSHLADNVSSVRLKVFKSAKTDGSNPSELRDSHLNIRRNIRSPGTNTANSSETDERQRTREVNSKAENKFQTQGQLFIDSRFNQLNITGNNVTEKGANLEGEGKGSSKRRRRKFAICVPPLFGRVPSTSIVEFIEFSRLLGADHVIFYRREDDVTPTVARTLDWYSTTGHVTVVPWRVPVSEKSVWYRAQLLAINDCLYRTMALRFNHVTFNDVDEYIVPHKHSNWEDMIESFEKSSSTYDLDQPTAADATTSTSPMANTQHLKNNENEEAAKIAAGVMETEEEEEEEEEEKEEEVEEEGAKEDSSKGEQSETFITGTKAQKTPPNLKTSSSEVVDHSSTEMSLIEAGYTFQSAFFDPLFLESAGHAMYGIESDLRTKVFSRVRSKVMVRPEAIFELGIHHVSRTLMPHHVIHAVDPSVAFVHHYRKCINDFDPTMICHVFTHDDCVSRFVPSLRHSVHQVLWRMKDAADATPTKDSSIRSTSLQTNAWGDSNIN